MLTPDNDRNIKLLLKETGDIAVVTKAYLQRFLLVNPGVKSRLLISDNLDQVYNHAVLLRPGILPSLDEVNAMLDELKKTGGMKKLFEKYGINQPIL
jgi:hypothetical protein